MLALPVSTVLIAFIDETQHPEKSRARARVVLEAMVDNGALSSTSLPEFKVNTSPRKLWLGSN